MSWSVNKKAMIGRKIPQHKNTLQGSVFKV